ncbi:MAG TPA: hypothetical protein VH274_00375 [Mycobacteriales bacterium]|nr:hypothetical protein [Mycobacteriales bacterium]
MPPGRRPREWKRRERQRLHDFGASALTRSDAEELAAYEAMTDPDIEKKVKAQMSREGQYGRRIRRLTNLRRKAR